MRIDLGDEYIRSGVPTFSEAEWMFNVLLDWPAGGWSLDRCLAQLSVSAQAKTDQAFNGLILVYCLADDTPVGLSRVNYYGGRVTGFSVDYAAIHPDHRGVGHFTKFSDGIAYYANQYLGADQGYYAVMESAPQVITRSRALNGLERAAEASASGSMTEIRLTKSETARAMAGRNIEVTE